MDRPNNLPKQLSTFVGRGATLEKVQGLLRDERVVTLTGTGGCGKTRLAVEAGWNALARFDDGVCVAERFETPRPRIGDLDADTSEQRLDLIGAAKIERGAGRKVLQHITIGTSNGFHGRLRIE